MAYSYPLALPTVTGFSRFTLRARNIVAVSVSPYTGEQQVYEHSGKWWEAEAELPPLTPAEAAEWETFLHKCNGVRGTFLMGDPAKATPRGTASGSPTVSGAHAARVTSLTLATGVNNITNWLRAGDHLQIGSGSSSRLHENLSDANTNGSGAVTLDIWPPTREALAGGEAITLSSPKGVFRLSENDVDAAREPGVFTHMGFKAMEVL